MIKTETVAGFPFPLVTVAGKDALATWQQLKHERKDVPVIIGAKEDLERLSEVFHPSMPSTSTPSQTLELAARLKMPDDLLARRASQDAASAKATADLIAGPDSSLPVVIETEGGATFTYYAPAGSPLGQHLPKGRRLSPSEVRAFLSRQPNQTDGAWPDQPPETPGLSVVTNLRTGVPFEKVYIALIPTDDWTTVPAHLRWGNWNDCPAPEEHVAAFRSWRDRYGAELIGMTGDVLNIRVALRPKTREDALSLAREQYAYCPDIVEQGVDTISALAAGLLADDWWYFWWD